MAKEVIDNLKVIDKAIEKNIKGLCDNEFTILKSIPGIGDVYAAGIISEIGSIAINLPKRIFVKSFAFL